MTKHITKTLIISTVIILLPIIYGVVYYQQLPAAMVTHWGFNNTPNGWMPKIAAVYGIPIGMMLLQWLIVGITQFGVKRSGGAPRMERIVYWLIPVITVVLYLTTIQANLGTAVDIRRVAMLLVAGIFILMGNYLPTVPGNSYHWGIKKSKSRPELNVIINRKLAHAMVISGLLCLLSIFFSVWVSTVAVIIAIGWVIGVSIYGMRLQSRR